MPTTAAILDIDSLLKPIAGASPAGPNLRDDISPQSIYRRLKAARQAARVAENAAAIDDEAAASVNWSPILDEAPRALAEHSKDLEVCAWLIEALVREKGFAGLRDGFRLAEDLIRTYWEGLHPRPDEEGISTLVGPLAGLNGFDSDGTLIGPIARVAISNGASSGTFAFWQYKQAVEIEQISDPEKKAQRLSAGGTQLGHVLASIAETEVGFLQQLLADLAQCREAHAKLCQALDERCGADSPPSSRIASALEEVERAVQTLSKDRLAAAGAEGSSATAAAGASTGSGAAGGASSGPFRTREEAFQVLLKVASYFRATEPHSPLSYSLEQAVRWGRMSLPELLEELIADDTVRDSYRRLVGIKKQQGGDS